MSVGKVLVGNLLGAKEHNDFIVHILHPASVESVFESRFVQNFCPTKLVSLTSFLKTERSLSPLA